MYGAMNIRQEISAVRPVLTLYAVPYYSRKCLLLCSACTACFHNTAQLHVCVQIQTTIIMFTLQFLTKYYELS